MAAHDRLRRLRRQRPTTTGDAPPRPTDADGDDRRPPPGGDDPRSDDGATHDRVEDPTATVTVPESTAARCHVGPAGATGEVFTNDAASVSRSSGEWIVAVGLSGGGRRTWNALAAQCYTGARRRCPQPGSWRS